MNSGSIPLVAASGNNNGVSYFSSAEKNFLTKGNKITISANGEGVGTPFYQKDDFVGGNDCLILENKYLNKINAMFIVTIIFQNKYKYSYGRKCSLDIIKNDFITLPAKDGNPDWEYMQNYIESLRNSDLI